MKKEPHEDRYTSITELKKTEVEGKDFEIEVEIRSSGVAVIAPHGGGIETGTSEIAKAIADEEHTFYDFRGIKEGGDNYEILHVTSTNFDEENALKVVKESNRVVAIHGRKEGAADEVYISGLDIKLREIIRTSLQSQGYSVRNDTKFTGRCPNNICNRGATKKGVQLELPFALRHEMFENVKVRAKRKITKPEFKKFVDAIKKSLKQ